jgi:beta-lactam-binding protein with PASTA domain
MAGSQLPKAEAMLTGIGLVPEVVRDQSDNYNTANIVLTTDPPAGSLIPWGSTVTLIISNGDDESPSTSTPAP